ncbi:MAG: OmpH family outer membrane protein [Alphaproteobacteria bacterium]
MGRLLVVGFAVTFLGLILPRFSAFSEEGSGEENDQHIDILVINIAEVQSKASVYLSIQAETERTRDLINAAYQERLARLQGRRNELLDHEGSLTSEEFQDQIMALEDRAIDLENSRRRNLGIIEAQRQDLLGIVGVQLTSIYERILEESQASFLFNQQSVLVAPPGAYITDLAIERLNELLPAINFEINITDSDNSEL